MIVTVEEAKEKWCPLAIDIGNNSSTCTVTRCMAWRWSTVPDDNRRPSTGYCGIAGKPVSTEKLLINVASPVIDEKTVDELIKKLEERASKNDVNLKPGE